jgi:hypothetical protein
VCVRGCFGGHAGEAGAELGRAAVDVLAVCLEPADLAHVVVHVMDRAAMRCRCVRGGRLRVVVIMLRTLD